MFGKLKNLFGGGELSICAPVSGHFVPLDQVSDPTFAQEILGPGAAIQPTGSRIVAPADGTINVAFDTGHAVSMTTIDGAELLIHVGIDTVNLKGQHYQMLVHAGDTVKAGDPLISFEADAIRAAGYDLVTPIILCNREAFSAVKICGAGALQENDPLLTLKK